MKNKQVSSRAVMKNKQVSSRPNRASPPLFPVVLSDQPEFRLSDSQLRLLEKEGGVVLDGARGKLESLGTAWISNELQRKSARPKDFFKILRGIGNPLKKARRTLELNPFNASQSQYHFLSWLVDQPQDTAASYLLVHSGELRHSITVMVDKVEELERSLPHDGGTARPFDDTRYILYLADIYERAGGDVKAYTSEYTETGMADTGMCRFALAYYKMLPGGKRKLKGFATALISALRQNRIKRDLSRRQSAPP